MSNRLFSSFVSIKTVFVLFWSEFESELLQRPRVASTRFSANLEAPSVALTQHFYGNDITVLLIQ